MSLDTLIKWILSILAKIQQLVEVCIEINSILNTCRFCNELISFLKGNRSSNVGKSSWLLKRSRFYFRDRGLFIFRVKQPFCWFRHHLSNRAFNFLLHLYFIFRKICSRFLNLADLKFRNLKLPYFLFTENIFMLLLNRWALMKLRLIILIIWLSEGFRYILILFFDRKRSQRFVKALCFLYFHECLN